MTGPRLVTCAPSSGKDRRNDAQASSTRCVLTRPVTMTTTPPPAAAAA